MPKVKTAPIKSLAREITHTLPTANIVRVRCPVDREWLEMYFDGGCRGNPGPCGSGVILYLVSKGDKDHNEHRSELWRSYRFMEHGTSNLAEYNAMLDGLEFLAEWSSHIKHFSLRIHGDSNLVVNQLNGNWRVRSENLRQVFNATSAIFDAICAEFSGVTLSHVRRTQNTVADGLANTAMDKRASAALITYHNWPSPQRARYDGCFLEHTRGDTPGSIAP